MIPPDKISINFQGEKRSDIAEYWMAGDSSVAVFKNDEGEPRYIELNPKHIHFFEDGVENIGACYLYNDSLKRADIKILTSTTKLSHRLAKFHEMAFKQAPADGQ